MYLYARENLAVVNIYIKDPVVTKIRRDQKVPIIWFIANCGGILGLCMGFSLITVFEIAQYFCHTACSELQCAYKRCGGPKENQQRGSQKEDAAPVNNEADEEIDDEERGSRTNVATSIIHHDT